MERGYLLLKSTSFDKDKREFRGMATTPDVDLVGDVVDPMGATFAETIPLLLQHDRERPIGTVKLGKATPKGIPFTAVIAEVDEPGVLKDRLDEAWQSIKAGLIKAVSVGMRVTERTRNAFGGYNITKYDIDEVSAVTFPANVRATIEMAKSLDTNHDPAASGIGTNNEKAGDTAQVQKRTKVNFSNKIAELEAELAETTEARDILLNKSLDSGLTAEEDGEYDATEARVAELTKSIARVKVAMGEAISKATPIANVKSFAAGSAVRARQTVKVGSDQLPEGVEFARFVKSLAIANGDPMRALEIAKAQYPSNERIHAVLKAAIPAGSTTDREWAGALTEHREFANDFIKFARPRTILGRFGTNGIPALRSIPFNVKVPRQIAGGAASWVAEGAAAPLTKFGFDTIELGHNKLSATAVLTNDLLRFASPEADILVRDGLADALTERLDIDFITQSVTKIEGRRPASITNGATTIASKGSVDADIDAATVAFITANMSTSGAVWVMSEVLAQQISRVRNPLGQREHPAIGPNGGELGGLPVLTSQYVPAGVMVLVSTSEIYLADDGQVTVDASREASLEMRDDPTMNSKTPTAAQMVSMWQTDSTAIKVVRHVNYERRRPEGVVVITGVDYSAPAPTAG